MGVKVFKAGKEIKKKKEKNYQGIRISVEDIILRGHQLRDITALYVQQFTPVKHIILKCIPYAFIKKNP